MILLLGLTVYAAAEEQSEFQRGLALRLEGKNAQAVEAFGKVPVDSSEYVRLWCKKGRIGGHGKKEGGLEYIRARLEDRPAEFFRGTQSGAVELGRNDGRRCQAPNPPRRTL